LTLLDPQKAYEGDKGMDGKNNYQIQRTLLDIFYELSKTGTYPVLAPFRPSLSPLHPLPRNFGGLITQVIFLEANQAFLGENNLLLTMQGFFLPLKQGSPYKWSFDVLLLVLRIIDNLLNSGTIS
jgi:hypothetical protein